MQTVYLVRKYPLLHALFKWVAIGFVALVMLIVVVGALSYREHVTPAPAPAAPAVVQPDQYGNIPYWDTSPLPVDNNPVNTICPDNSGDC